MFLKSFQGKKFCRVCGKCVIFGFVVFSNYVFLQVYFKLDFLDLD